MTLCGMILSVLLYVAAAWFAGFYLVKAVLMLIQ